jgi:O-antigen ligase
MIPVPGNVLAGARVALAAALFAYPAFMLIVPRVPGWALGLMLIGSTILLPVALSRRAQLARAEDLEPVIGLFLFLAVGAASAVAWHGPEWLVINYVRLFAALAIIAAIRMLKPPEWVFYAGCAVGAVGAGGYAAWQVFGEGATRASGPDIYFGWWRATIFGGLSIVLGFLPILANPHTWPRACKALLMAGVAGGIVAAVLSASRGAWLAGMILAIWRVRRGKPWAAPLLLALLVGASVMLPMVSDRWNDAFGDLLSYENGHTETSLGKRFGMWKAAVAAFIANPLFGVGPLGFQGVLTARFEAGLGPASLVEFDHAHSDVMHALASGGLVALAGLISLFWLPWRYFRRIAASEDSPAAHAGIALIVSFVILGLTDTMLVHRIALSMYVVGIAVLVGFAGIPRLAAASRDAPVASGRRGTARAGGAGRLSDESRCITDPPGARH